MMEDILKQIVSQLNKMESKMDSMGNRMDSIENKIESIENKVGSMENRMEAFENNQKSLIAEQSEMRKEVGFYYASMMKKMDETKTELSSEIKQVTAIQKQHQSVLEYLNDQQ